MSLFTTIRSWLFGPTIDNAHVNLHQSCRFRLDNDTSAIMTLPDGRKLGYAEYGLATGIPVLYHHGFPGSRLEAAQHHDICKELGLRMISIDRPGYGWSSPHPRSKLLDWPKDIERLTEHLGLETYAVMGASGGGPVVLACAYALPAEKLKCVSIICGVGPPDIGMQGADFLHRLGWPHGIPLTPYWLARMYWRTQTLARLDLSEDTRVRMVLKELRNAPEKDRDICTDVDLLRLTVRSWTEAFAQGPDYVWDDGVKSCMPFGFRVEDVREELIVQLWYGRNDSNVPPLHGYQIAARLGGRAQLRMEDETHSGIYVHWAREILENIKNSM